MPNESSNRYRWTEIIVAVTIVMLLAALVAPAILAAREAARRQQCEDNLRCLSLGVVAYTDTFQHFPAGTVGSRELSPSQRFSWYLPLWAFIEGKPPVLQVDTNQAWDADVNRSPQLKRVYSLDAEERLKSYPLHYIRIFGCPSASRSLQVQGIQVTQYVGMAGLGKNAPELSIGDTGVGIWGYDRQAMMRDITDGTANTILLLETVRDLGPWFAGGPPTVRGLDLDAAPLFGVSGQFGGLHVKIPATMADASVRSIDPRIDPRVLKLLTTIAGDEKH